MHLLNLAAALLEIHLIDAYGIDPQPRMVGPWMNGLLCGLVVVDQPLCLHELLSDPDKCSVQVLSDWNGLAVTHEALHVVLRAPGI